MDLDLEEEERKIRGGLAYKELLVALGGSQSPNPMCISLQDRNFSYKGVDVEPSGKQQKIVESLARSIKYSPPVTKRRSIGETTLFSTFGGALGSLGGDADGANSVVLQVFVYNCLLIMIDLRIYNLWQ